MSGYFNNIGVAISTLWDGLRITMRHFVHKKQLNATLQYPRERWPLPDRSIGFEEAKYNTIRTRLHVDIDDCIGCMQCVRACPVDCIKIDTIKAPKETDLGTTSNGTPLRLLVSRFDIDMAECCYCNLCTFPCPEDCIYMTGGPNAAKRPLDYEFSVRNRDNLVFQFATASDEQVAEIAQAAGVSNPRTARAARREAFYQEPAEAVDVTPAEQPAPVAKAAGAKLDLAPLSAIEDRVTRGLAKKTAMGAMRAGKSPAEVAAEVQAALKEAGKLTAEIGAAVAQLAEVQAATDQPLAQQPAAGPEIDLTTLSAIEDRVTRGLAKKTALGAKRAGKTPAEVAAAVKGALEEAGKLTPEIATIVAGLAGTGETTPTAPEAPAKVDLSWLDGITDRLARGKAKAILNRVLRQGGSVQMAADEIRTNLSGLGKLNSEIEEILTKMEN